MVTKSTEALGNTRLVQHGILNEQSDIRAHVCVNSKTVWVFKTQAAVEAVKSGKWKSRDVFTPVNGKRVVTAKGCPVPPGAIVGAIAVPADDVIAKADFRDTDDNSTKGRKAAQVVADLLAQGRFPLWGIYQPVTEKQMQVKGVDIHVHLDTHIEVKADIRGGVGEGTTGNLFLQYAECNPYKLY